MNSHEKYQKIEKGLRQANGGVHHAKEEAESAYSQHLQSAVPALYLPEPSFPLSLQNLPEKSKIYNL